MAFSLLSHFPFLSLSPSVAVDGSWVRETLLQNNTDKKEEEKRGGIMNQ